MEKQRRRNAELEQKFEQELKLLAQEERARAKEFEEQLAARRRQPPAVEQPTTSRAAAIDSPNATPVYRPPEK